MKNDSIYIDDILTASQKIISLVEGVDYKQFFTDHKTHDAIMYNFIIIGEASNKISSDFKLTHSLIEWHKLRGMRNHLAHSYDEINYKTIWDTIKNELPNLIDKLNTIR